MLHNAVYCKIQINGQKLLLHERVKNILLHTNVIYGLMANSNESVRSNSFVLYDLLTAQWQLYLVMFTQTKMN